MHTKRGKLMTEYEKLAADAKLLAEKVQTTPTFTPVTRDHGALGCHCEICTINSGKRAQWNKDNREFDLASRTLLPELANAVLILSRALRMLVAQSQAKDFKPENLTVEKTIEYWINEVKNET